MKTNILKLKVIRRIGKKLDVNEYMDHDETKIWKHELSDFFFSGLRMFWKWI